VRGPRVGRPEDLVGVGDGFGREKRSVAVVVAVAVAVIILCSNHVPLLVGVVLVHEAEIGSLEFRLLDTKLAGEAKESEKIGGGGIAVAVGIAVGIDVGIGIISGSRKESKPWWLSHGLFQRRRNNPMGGTPPKRGRHSKDIHIHCS